MHTFRRLLIGLGVAFAASLCVAQATSYDEALAAYRQDDFVRARALAEPLAAAGDHDAQTLLGVLYWRGRGVERDDAVAFTWFSKAAAQSDAEALSYLGRMYEQGEGVAEDTRKAFDAFLRAAELGSKDGQSNLGRAYHRGVGVRKDLIRARYWYEHADAQEFMTEKRERAAPLVGPPTPMKLTDDCRPRTVPVANMRRLGVSNAEGTIAFAVDNQGKVRGVIEQNLSEPELRFDVVAYFSDSLRSETCVWDVSTRGRRFVIPFRLQLTRW